MIERIPLAALAGQLVVAATSLIRLDALTLAWRVNFAARSALLVTLGATLVLPLEYSVYIGVAISLLFYAWSSARNLQVRRLVQTADGAFREEALPQHLSGRQPLVVSVAGNLYFAAVPLLEELLPQPAEDSERPVVVLRLRDNLYLGSTGIRFLKDYARKLEAAGGRLLLAGVSQGRSPATAAHRRNDLAGANLSRGRSDLCLDAASPSLGGGLAAAAGPGDTRRFISDLTAGNFPLCFRRIQKCPNSRFAATRPPPPGGAYSQALRAGDFVFVSGIGPAHPETGSAGRHDRGNRRPRCSKASATSWRKPAPA